VYTYRSSPPNVAPAHSEINLENRSRICATLFLSLFIAQGTSSLLPPNAHAQGDAGSGSIRDRLREKLGKENPVNCTKFQIAGLETAVWKPANTGKAPLVIFSHGFGGFASQSGYIMRAMANAGYLVIAVDHKDAHGSPETDYRPQVSFSKFKEWSDKTYIDRHDDIVKLIAALHADPTWNQRIDWTELALCGHSLGGYTALGLAGAWPSWKIPGVKAVIALSPYTLPFTATGALNKLQTPVLYQGGTKDFGITPFVKRPGGAYSQTSSPAYFVEFDQFNHFTWTNFNRDLEKQKEVNYYCIAFLDKYLRGKDAGRLSKKLPGVVEFQAK